MFRTVVLVLALAPACGGNAKNNPDTPKDAAPAPTPAPPPPAPAPEPAKTPQDLYTECRDRVEGKEADAECKADADCATAGCGKEVCVTAAEAVNVMTTCEEKPCFKVLDACGCHEGKCTWTVKAEMPPPAPSGPAGKLPSSLPPTVPKPAGSDPAGAKPPEPAPAPAPAPAPK